MAEFDRLAIQRAYESGGGPLPADPQTDALLTAVAKVVASARARHPGLGVTTEDLIAKIGAIVGFTPESCERVERMCVGDLLLALAAVSGEPMANQLVNDILQAEVRPLLRHRIDADEARLDEIMQLVRVRMVVGESGKSPKLLMYTASGRLAAWARVLAVRVAYNLLGRASALACEELEDSLIQTAVVANNDPELQLQFTRYAPLLKAAMAEAVASLPARERTLLRLSLVEALSIDQIGAIYNRNRATAARWIKAAKESLAEGARVAFCRLAGVPEVEFASLLRALPGYFDLSVGRLLGQPPDTTDAS